MLFQFQSQWFFFSTIHGFFCFDVLQINNKKKYIHKNLSFGLVVSDFLSHWYVKATIEKFYTNCVSFSFPGFSFSSVIQCMFYFYLL